MTVANIDLEIRSALDLTAAGAHLTASHPTTRILCMGWALDGMQEQMWWPGMPFPVELANHILAGGEVHAWNAAYERVNWPLMVAHHGAPDVRPEQWRCTMVRALLQGFPAKLEHAGPSMGLGECKDAEGHRLMLQVTKPRKVYRPGDANYDLALELALQDPGLLPEYEWFREEGKLCVAQWWVDEPRLTRLGNYCKQDVRVERKAGRFLDPLPPLEHEGWLLDQRINDRGFKIDMELVQAARALMKPALADANRKLAKLTDGELRSVTKPNEIRAWFNQRLGLELDSIGKDVLGILLVECPMDDTTRAVINLRLAAAKTSTAKLNALVRGVGDDHIMRGGLQFAGAGRTNRWAGRRFQPHNLPRPPKWAVRAVPYVLERNLEWLEALFDMPLEVISAILRSCIVAREGGELMAADYNAIEARLTAWFAGAAKLLEAYRTGKDPYRIMAATVFGVSDWTTIGKDSFERWLGKKIILGCGFGMGEKRFWESCREEGQFIDRSLAQLSVRAYRDDNWEIPEAWNALQQAAISAVQTPGTWVRAMLRGTPEVWFYRDDRYLRMRLPSGRLLSYLSPRLLDDETPWGAHRYRLEFWGWNGTRNRMEWQNLYGGRLMENLAQATARDIMLDAMLRLDREGWGLILTIHDEILTDNKKGALALDTMLAHMSRGPQWAEGLPLLAEGWTGHRYRK